MKQGARVGEALSLADFETLAAQMLSPMVFQFIWGGAADEKTVRWNEAAFDALKLYPRVLRGVASVDTRLDLLGRKLPFPILLGPTGYHRLVHSDGELATAAGASRAGALLVVSSSSTTPIEQIAPALGGPFWFQLYLQPDPSQNEELIRRVEASGASALCLTVDTPTLGARNREQRVRFSLPPDLATPMNPLTDQKRRAPGAPDWQRYATRWADVESLLAMTRLPLVLKGILHPDDAERAAELGIAALVVSNHGGRNLDSGLSPIEALPPIVDRLGGKLPLLVDGGIRRGTDVVKALALGATAVLVGRPYLYGLAVGGAEGVARVVDILRTELEMAMALVGCASIADIDRRTLFPTPGPR